MALPSLLFGVLSTLGPLHLSHAGWGAAAIGAIWLVGAGLESVQAPLVGRFSDRRGLVLPVRIALAATAYGTLFTPAFILLSRGAEHAGLAQGMAFGFMNAAWALGAMLGPAAGGAIAGATGDWIPYVLAALACLGALAATRSDHERAAVLVDRLPGDATGVGRQ
jgi:hypothetical protein